MPFREIERKKDYMTFHKYSRDGYIVIPPVFRKYFKNKVKLLFDPKKNLVALQPSDEESAYPLSHWRIWCTAFFREYNIPDQKVKALWDEKNRYLIAKIRRE